jgi:hypothetical protein
MIDIQYPFGRAEGEFTLCSNSGHCEMKWTLLRHVAVDDAAAYLCALKISGRNRREPVGQGEWHVVDESAVHFHQVVMSALRLAELARALNDSHASLSRLQ